VDLDSVDRTILAELAREGRMTNEELARRVNLSPSACARRVSRMVEADVILGYQAIIAPSAIDRGLKSFAGINLLPHTREVVGRFEREVLHVPGVLACFHVTGNFDFLLQIEVTDTSALEEAHQRLTALPGVEKVTNYVVMQTLTA
jgi:Lrp/AsnC family transcriptional regulator, leucine-responsive regulatory protein